MKKQLTILLVALITLTTHSQLDNTVSINDLLKGDIDKMVSPATPEAYSLGKYGDIPIDERLGMINFQIQLYEIKLAGYSLPIYLSYAYSGLKVEEDAGIVGLGWSLHAGGLISRQIKGLGPDERAHGYLSSHIGENYVLPFFNSTITDDALLYLKKMSLANNTFVFGDTEPDIFKINMENLHGNYSHNPFGEPVKFPQTNYIIKDRFNAGLPDGVIKLIDDKGVKYDFSEPVITEYTNDQVGIGIYVNEWWVKKIEVPNTYKTIEFEYLTQSNSLPITYNKTRKSEYKVTRSNYSHTGSANICNSIHSGHFTLYQAYSINRKFIKEIVFPEGRLLFDVQKAPISNYYYLNRIDVQRKTANGNYENMYYYLFEFNDVNNDKKLLLKVRKFNNNDVEIPFYEMEYTGTVYNSLNTNSQDKWGYYNGHYNQNLLDGNREPVFNKAILGSLNKIIYPAKGYSTIEYEENRFITANQDVVAGGIRVKEIKSCTDANNCITTTYSYIDENGYTSGKFIVPNEIKYKTQRITNTIIFSDFGHEECDVLRESVTSATPLIGLGGGYVFYDRVVIDDSKGRIIKIFDDNFPLVYTDYANEQYWKKGKPLQQIKQKKEGSTYTTVATTDYEYTSNYPYPPANDAQHKQFAIGTNIDIVHYKYLNNGLLDTSFETSLGLHIIRPEFYQMTKKTDKMYYSSGEVTQVSNYEYDDLTGNLKMKSKGNSLGGEEKIEYAYAYDIESTTSLGNIPLSQEELGAYIMMQSPTETHPDRQNRISEPIETKLYNIDNNGQELILGTRRTTYKNYEFTIMVNGQPVIENNITMPNKVYASKNGHDLEEKIIYHNYDIYGNPIEVSKAEDTHIYYVWGYNHSRLLAEIVNLKGTDINSNIQSLIDTVITVSDYDIDSSSEDALRTALNNLRNALPDNTQMTFYTYDPLVGVTSITDPKGDTQFYIYDSFNRLKQIKDKDGHILKEYDYHYKP